MARSGSPTSAQRSGSPIGGACRLGCALDADLRSAHTMAVVDESGAWVPAPTRAPAHWEPLRLLVGATFAIDGLAEPLRVWAAELLGLPLAFE